MQWRDYTTLPSGGQSDRVRPADWSASGVTPNADTLLPPQTLGERDHRCVARRSVAVHQCARLCGGWWRWRFRWPRGRRLWWLWRQHWATSSHSITSSARASSVGGTSMPSALAVLRWITSSYLVGAWTGSTLGFSPLRMRST